MTVPICILCSLVHLNGPEKASDFDQYGRYTDATRRNVYANFFHIAITSGDGRLEGSWLVQRGNDKDLTPVKLAETNLARLHTRSAHHLAYVKTTVTWVVDASADVPLLSMGKMVAYVIFHDCECQEQK
ncbi:hypothetical protein KXD40_008870 [Peronospora effusa]|nr:hypothetical protein KXD40_008870 [Peronospora effusa]